MTVSYKNISFRLFLASISIAAVGSDDSTDFQKSLPAQLIWAVPGKDAELPCDVTTQANDRVSMVLWFKGTTGIPLYSLDARGGALEHATHWAMGNDLGGRSNFLMGKYPSTARLRINKVALSDEGVYRCRIDYYNSPTKNLKINLTLAVEPSEPIIYDAQGREVTQTAGPFMEGYDLFLSCHVVGGRPRPVVTWWKNGKIVDAEMESVTPTLSVNQFRSNVTRHFFNTTLECRANTIPEASTLVKEANIEVYLKPKEVKISMVTRMLSAGRPQQYQCETWGSIPPGKIMWFLEGEPIRNAKATPTQEFNLTVSVVTYRPTPEDDGKELTCRAENPKYPGSILEKTTRLTVHYVPGVAIRVIPGGNLDNLKEGDEVQFICKIRSNPEPSLVAWFHGDMFVRQNESQGIIIKEKTLELRNLTMHQAGEYSCAAKNSEGEARSQSLNLRVQFAPRCKFHYLSRKIGALRRDPLTVRCEVMADPWLDVKFHWTYNNSHEVLPMPASRINSSKLASHVEYTPVTDADFGTLACWATNKIGRQVEPCMSHIFPAKVPEPPKDCRLQNHTAGGLEVICRPDSDGGLRQHFELEVTEIPEDAQTVNDTRILYFQELPRYKMSGSEPRFLLRGLESDRSYRLAVFAVNAKGRSDPPIVIPKVKIESASARLTSTESVEDETDPDKDNPMVIILGTLIGVAILIIAGISTVAALFACRKKTTLTDQQIHQDYETVIREAQEALEKKEAFIVKVPTVARDDHKPKKINNSLRKSIHEVLPLQVDVNSLRNVHDVLAVEESSIQTVVIRRNPTSLPRDAAKSLSFTPVNNNEKSSIKKSQDCVYHKPDSNRKEEKPVLVRTSYYDEHGKRNHPRVTLGPDGEVMRCVIAQDPVAEASSKDDTTTS